MLNFSADVKIFLCVGSSDMRKGIHGLSLLSSSINLEGFRKGAMFVFRGKRADRLKILWWDGQGFCLFYKCLDRGKFPWLNGVDSGSIGITRAQLAMLLEGIDWRNPSWSNAPLYAG